MKFDKVFILSFVAPIMILISTLGLVFRQSDKKVFYLPIGLMGIVLILEKDITRKFNRRNILRKIKSYQKIK